MDIDHGGLQNFSHPNMNLLSNPIRSPKDAFRRLRYRVDRSRRKAEIGNKAHLSYPPPSVTIGVTSACANQCLFCGYHSEDAKDISNVYGLDYRLDLSDFKAMVGMCYRGFVPKVHICGTGEPFMHPDILKMIDYTANLYGYATVQTNFCKSVFERRGYIAEIRDRKKIHTITTDVMAGNADLHNDLKKGSDYEYLMDTLEYLSRTTRIAFRLHLILTKKNYTSIAPLVDEMARRSIRGQLEVVNLDAYGFNALTHPESAYRREDSHITRVLEEVSRRAFEKGVSVVTPSFVDAPNRECRLFWLRFQTWPVKGCNPNRYAENVIVGGCNAVVRGNLKSLGYFFDYDNIMDLWNNEQFVHIRRKLIHGVYPDNECVGCMNWDPAGHTPG